jgi:hypothetical protein
METTTEYYTLRMTDNRTGHISHSPLQTKDEATKAKRSLIMKYLDYRNGNITATIITESEYNEYLNRED